VVRRQQLQARRSRRAAAATARISPGRSQRQQPCRSVSRIIILSRCERRRAPRDAARIDRLQTLRQRCRCRSTRLKLRRCSAQQTQTQHQSLVQHPACGHRCAQNTRSATMSLPAGRQVRWSKSGRLRHGCGDMYHELLAEAGPAGDPSSPERSSLALPTDADDWQLGDWWSGAQAALPTSSGSRPAARGSVSPSTPRMHATHSPASESGPGCSVSDRAAKTPSQGMGRGTSAAEPAKAQHARGRSRRVM
jgi:hypothetical protein